MAGETKLGTAVVPIRATMDELDKDLAQAKAKCETASGGLSKALGGIKWAAVGAGATALAGAMGDLARAGAEDEASMMAVSVAAENAAARFDEVSCRGGEIGTIPSKELLPLALAHAGKLNRFGA